MTIEQISERVKELYEIYFNKNSDNKEQKKMKCDCIFYKNGCNKHSFVKCPKEGNNSDER